MVETLGIGIICSIYVNPATTAKQPMKPSNVAVKNRMVDLGHSRISEVTLLMAIFKNTLLMAIFKNTLLMVIFLSH